MCSFPVLAGYPLVVPPQTDRYVPLIRRDLLGWHCLSCHKAFRHPDLTKAHVDVGHLELLDGKVYVSGRPLFVGLADEGSVGEDRGVLGLAEEDDQVTTVLGVDEDQVDGGPVVDRLSSELPGRILFPPTPLGFASASGSFVGIAMLLAAYPPEVVPPPSRFGSAALPFVLAPEFDATAIGRVNLSDSVSVVTFTPLGPMSGLAWLGWVRVPIFLPLPPGP